MVEKSRYEIQKRKLDKARRLLWRKIATWLVVIYIGGVILGYVGGLPVLSTARTLMVGLVLIVISMIMGGYMQSEVDKRLLPPPEERESPELERRIKDVDREQ